MATKKRSWFSFLKRLFNAEPKSEKVSKILHIYVCICCYTYSHWVYQKEIKRRRWIFGRLSSKRLASIQAPPSSTRERSVSDQAEEEQNRHALEVAIASTAAAEAALAAAQVAAEVVVLTSTIPPPSNGFSHLQIQELSAIKIQTAFRAYLARKALRALKGIVKLQALIRGRAVRRQAMNTLKCLQSLVNIQSQVCTRRINISEATLYCDESRNLQTLKDKIIKIDTNSQKRWDDRNLTKEEAEAMVLSKNKAAIKRERIKEYAFSHRKSAESEQDKGNGKWKYWLEKWVDTQLSKSRELEHLDLSWNQNQLEESVTKQVTKPRKNPIQESGSPIAEARRSFHHRKQCSLGEDNSFSTSPPVLPTYMAATESAKAKTRSLSSPKLRPGSFDTQSETYSPYKNKLSVITNVSGDQAASNDRICRHNSYQQRSPSLRVLPAGPIKSNRSLKDLSFNSECSFSNWTQSSPFR
ncbi:protein IQ-DOMAIN 14 isoform X2 [Carica papaya]|uniref:protein IQ-DOMAIN 14 isoform X2 n=1 Tax=Carica papaya TaxID=3649 RepID=UPI000B8CB495|nr:protein IQ-DOMAIN 14 isoform X2 [Carica papaya]